MLEKLVTQYNIDNSTQYTTNDIDINGITFDNAYKMRILLFAFMCNYNDHAWKSEVDAEGKDLGDWFIAGIDSIYGQLTYHANYEEFYSLFRCREVEKSRFTKDYDSNDVARRLALSLGILL